MEGDYVLLLKKDDSGWYQGDIGGVIGWVSFSSVARLPLEMAVRIFGSR